MDELRDYFNKPGGTRRIKIRGPQTSGIHLTKHDISNFSRPEDRCITDYPRGTEYARQYQQEELQRFTECDLELVQNSNNEPTNVRLSPGLNSMENLSVIGTSSQAGLTDEVLSQVYSNYSFKRDTHSHLSINSCKADILNAISSQPVTIIEGPTGCGKTTQVPQWILDSCYEARVPCNIVVTQPRRIAAISIAKRVAQERGWDLGGLIGYQVGLDNKTSTETRLHYVTTGVLLQKLVSAQINHGFTHIVLDEIHERGQEMDFLLLVVRRLAFTHLLRFKIILMSATFNAADFAKYFAMPSKGQLEISPVIKITKKNPFDVKFFYLNQLSKFVNPSKIMQQEPAISREGYLVVMRLLVIYESIDIQEGEYEDCEDETGPSVLVFLPGINEIEELYHNLGDAKLREEVGGQECVNAKWWVVPLHSTITADEQARVFQRAPPGHRKIILSTNIAESSITVPDIKYVIDFCLMKVLVADPTTNFTTLQLQWASVSNCKQRAGRAGRVRDGRVYRLVSEEFYVTLPIHCDPEMKRCPLERLVLLSKMLNMGSPKEILGLAMDPPDLLNIRRTVLTLKEIGAMYKTLGMELSLDDGDVTCLGRIMSKLPVDVRVSKLIMLGYVFGCMEDCIIMGAAMTVKNIFSSPFMERLNAYNSKLTWADGSTSDCFAFLQAYKVWRHMHRTNNWKKDTKAERQWCRNFFIQVRAMKELYDLVRELTRRLSGEGISQENQVISCNKAEMSLIYKIVLAGAFYPHYFIPAVGDEAREREAVRVLGGHDPRNTVYLKDFPSNQPGEVYAASIRGVIQKYTKDNVRVLFDENSNKVYLTFSKKDNESDMLGDRNPKVPGKVLLSVYKAVKVRQLNLPIAVKLLPQEAANTQAAVYKFSHLDLSLEMLVPKLPDIDDSYMYIDITHFKDCGHFWAKSDDDSTRQVLDTISNQINNRSLLANTSHVLPGNLFAAPFNENGTHNYYRARVQKVMPNAMVWVYYIDYGGFGRVNSGDLKVLPLGLCRETPPLALECVLAEVAPSLLLDGRGCWTTAAGQYMGTVIRGQRLLAKVYSVAHGVVSVTLLVNGQLNINEMLTEKGYAQSAEETYESKQNHDMREKASEYSLSQKNAMNRQQIENAYQDLREMVPPNPKDCVSEVSLKGPFSPLERNLQTLIYGSRMKTVKVEWNSVNAVLLDTDPQEPFERLLVAGCVGQNQRGDSLTLRHTTLLPHLPGLPAIMSMLFCPTMELRRNQNKTHYASVLCGLGYYPNGQPLFPEHDMLVNIDVDLDTEDTAKINHIRHLMDFTLQNIGNSPDTESRDLQDKAKIPVMLLKLFNYLLGKRRKYCERVSVPNAWQWLSMPAAEVLSSEDFPNYGAEAMFPLHDSLLLEPESEGALRLLYDENQKLHATVESTSTSSSNVELVCKLCGSLPMSMQAMRIHLYSRTHREKEEDFRIFNA